MLSLHYGGREFDTLIIVYKLLLPVGPLQRDLLKDWTAETHRPSMQPGIQRPHTRPVLSILTLLIAQALATAAYRLFGFDTVGLHAGIFFEKCHFL